ncbi:MULTISPECIES: LIC_13387 family protein [unclassified Aureispira]|uniref:LIC_13387 family protein n=1 Tax=unclassified Aureispira TaxID=2649989 RepID=UPI000696DC5E|nr:MULTISPECIES: hypothetical protein [unclassified Aureispira]WMX15736.1 hypothetical protein QP953_04985 [Aureispira sp. CCB-E]
MKNSALYQKIGSWAFILIGTLHLSGHFLMTPTEKQLILAAQMEQFTVAPLFMETNILNFYNGFSILMAVLIMGYGILNLLLSKAGTNKALNIRSILLLNSLVASIACIVSILYFFILPIVFTGVAAIMFGLAYLSLPTPSIR